MPIEIQCQQCQARFRVGDQYAGKRVKCAKCRATIVVEAAAPAEEPAEVAPTVPQVQKPAAAKPVAGEPAETKKPAAAEAGGDWFMQTEEGEQYGPVSKAELDAWVTEGRLDGGCQVLRDGWDQWKWAEEVYPQLSSTPAAPPTAEPIEVAPITATMPAPVLPQVSVTPAAEAAAPVAEIGTAIRGGRSIGRRGHPAMDFAIQSLPICAWIVAGVVVIVAGYLAYEFITTLSKANEELSKMPEEFRKMASGTMTKAVLAFLVSEVAMLVSGFVSFVLLRALPEWMTLSLKTDQQVQSLTEKTAHP